MIQTYKPTKQQMENALIHFAKEKQLHQVEKFINYGVDIHCQHNKTLQLAVKNDHLDMVEFLIENGADPHDSDGSCYSALESSIVLGNMSILEFFVNHEVDIYTDRVYLLHLANTRSHEGISNYLKEQFNIIRTTYNLNKKYEVSRHG